MEKQPFDWLREHKSFRVIPGNRYFVVWQYENDSMFWCELNMPLRGKRVAHTSAGHATLREAEAWAVNYEGEADE